MLEPAIYRGTLRHRRFAPVGHAFTYPLFMVLLDIDRIAETMARSRLSSHNQWNWASFDDRDHFGDPRLALRDRLGEDARANGIPLPDGRIFLLTHLRYLGYAFNPVSFYYCYDAADTLRVILAEVNNTYGGTQNYWLTDAVAISGAGLKPCATTDPVPGATIDPIPGSAGLPPSRVALRRTAVALAEAGQSCAGPVRRYQRRKAMYVSPFLEMDQQYTFAFTEPESQLVAHMTVGESDVVRFDATLRLSRTAWTAQALRRALLAHPWMTARVISAIHWQALKLYLRGVPVVPRPDDESPEVAGRQVLGCR